ncbi:unnamed protein product [Penicillium salamii]|uniref:Peptide N-acetyl-beta-D-glucosaminyl asparaginase amidase A N-terminal domain-containing protein n=1 Tax=Penicillium salamii TaxID=1612424 RepID=A0A9W4JDR0_9EURO|nr:unnamed protein product [Penicillium salamii]CAG8258190.1 unnamed protein product [Penicillium salamii]CAG8313688.1 unnamed protein product [Penicillium salamii]CAG8359749.1 unnamed protein product [Penicillium salamii]CAG8387551.1 unnamed protein product [Penicillium salamii]
MDQCSSGSAPVEPNTKRRDYRWALLALGLIGWLSAFIAVVILFRHNMRDLARRLSSPPSTSLQGVFQVSRPIQFNGSGANGCDVEIVLMEHIFGASYGVPFVGNYEPPDCNFDTVRIDLTITSRGRQFDRLASMYLGDNEVFRTSTAEPRADGIIWTYVKDMSQYNSLWKSPQTLIFDLGNLITDVYTGSFNATLKAHFSYENNVKTADLILPISARKSTSNSASAFHLPRDNTTVMYTIPAAVSRAVVSISACGQSQEEFWWSNVFSGDTQVFDDPVYALYGYTPFREIQLYIDGVLAGLVWPFPIIFTGGLAPGLWHPIVGIDAFDLREPEVDISPFLSMIQDGEQHSFEIRVTGLDVSPDGDVTFSNTVGSYWTASGNIFLYCDSEIPTTKPIVARRSERPEIEDPPPTFTVTRDIAQNKTGGNDSLSYSVSVKRYFQAKSSFYSWVQSYSFFTQGLLSQQGSKQVHTQLTTGNNTITKLGETLASHSVAFGYPLFFKQSYGNLGDAVTVRSRMERGLHIDATGGLGLSTYTMSSGPSHIHTRQSGDAHSKYITDQNSSSWGETFEEFASSMDGQSFQRTVLASNGSLVYDITS